MRRFSYQSSSLLHLNIIYILYRYSRKHRNDWFVLNHYFFSVIKFSDTSVDLSKQTSHFSYMLIYCCGLNDFCMVSLELFFDIVIGWQIGIGVLSSTQVVLIVIKRVAPDWIALRDNEAWDFHFSIITALPLITLNSELATPTDPHDLLLCPVAEYEPSFYVIDCMTAY